MEVITIGTSSSTGVTWLSVENILVVQYLSVARQYEMSTRLEVPKLKHAPTTLTSSLEEYFNDPDFEVNRRQYLAQKQARKDGKPAPRSATGTLDVRQHEKCLDPGKTEMWI